KNITAEPSLSNWTPGYVDYGENTEHNCLILVELKALAAVCMAISLCGLVGNSLVVCFLGFHVKHNPFTIYVTNLAVLDFCMLLLFLLLMLAVLSFSAFCRHDSISLYLDFVFAAVILCQYIHINSLAFLTAMSVQQCLDVL
ncbi:MRGRD protein, partial [Psilopogon haemacephalus]|nr:MRGRD protein [Psilopogon haemacephalus]